MTYTIPDFGPSDLLTSAREGTRRVRVDVAQTGFWEAREFRISYPLEIPAASPVVIEFVSPVDFVLQSQALTSDSEGILMQVYRQAQGVTGGVFADAVPIYPNNFQLSAPEYTRKINAQTGGTFTPSAGQVSVETIRLRVSTATAQESTVGGTLRGERGLPPGAYYIKFSNITGGGTATGVYTLVFEERPIQGGLSPSAQIEATTEMTIYG
jgi:hypothetical protein